MTSQLKEQIATKTTEIYNLEVKLQALQVAAQTAPVADSFDSQQEFLEATRNYHQSERDRLDEVASIQAYLPTAQAKLKELRDRFDGIKSPVEKHLEDLKAAAFKANKLIEQADKAYQEVLEMANHQAALGHEVVFGTRPLHLSTGFNPIVFAVSQNQISVLARQQFLDYQKSGNVSEGTTI